LLHLFNAFSFAFVTKVFNSRKHFQKKAFVGILKVTSLIAQVLVGVQLPIFKFPQTPQKQDLHWEEEKLYRSCLNLPLAGKDGSLSRNESLPPPPKKKERK